MMASPIARLSDGFGALPRPVRAGLWIGCALAVLYALTLLTEGRSGGEWTSPPRRAEAPAAAAEGLAPAWTDTPAPARPEPAPPVLSQAGPIEPQEAGAQAAGEPASPARIAQSAKPHSRGMKGRRSLRRGTRHAREPIHYRLADRPGL